MLHLFCLCRFFVRLMTMMSDESKVFYFLEMELGLCGQCFPLLRVQQRIPMGSCTSCDIPIIRHHSSTFAADTKAF